MLFQQNWKDSLIWDFIKKIVLYGNKLDERMHVDKFPTLTES